MNLSGDDGFVAAVVTFIVVAIAVAAAADVDVAAVATDENVEVVDSELNFECEAVGQQIVE